MLLLPVLWSNESRKMIRLLFISILRSFIGSLFSLPNSHIAFCFHWLQTANFFFYLYRNIFHFPHIQQINRHLSIDIFQFITVYLDYIAYTFLVIQSKLVSTGTISRQLWEVNLRDGMMIIVGRKTWTKNEKENSENLYCCSFRISWAWACSVSILALSCFLG